MKVRPRIPAPIVEARQWFPDVPVDGVVYRGAEILYSRSGQEYYITMGRLRPRTWLGVAKLPGEVPAGKRDGGFLEPAYYQIKIPSTGEIYHRIAYDFVTWSLKSGARGPIDTGDELFLDYAGASGWTPEDVEAEGRLGFVDRGGKLGLLWIRPGDWVLTEQLDGAPVAVALSAEEFEERYEAAE